MNAPLVILASSRKKSNTEKLIEKLFEGKNIIPLDLLDFKIYPYNYEGSYPADDQFPELVIRIVEAETVVFATPVYWYSMSAVLKTFFDRLTDIVTIQKAAGRKMKGKNIFLVAVGTDPALPEGFEVPFRRTSEYLEMNFRATFYCSTEGLKLPFENKPEFLSFFHA